jgi:Cu+-exporting ATPase
MPNQSNLSDIKRFAVTGASCAGCVRKIENALAKLDEVDSASLNFADRSLCVAGSISEQDVIKSIESIGYGAQSRHHSSLQKEEEIKEQQHQQELSTLFKRSLISLAFGAGLMFWGMSNGMQINNALQAQPWLLIGMITLAVMLFAGKAFYQIGWKSLTHLAPSMDTLVAIGTIAAWLYSMLVVLFFDLLPEVGQHVYFEASVMILGFVNLGRYLEVRARSQTSDAIKELLKRQADEAILITKEGDISCAVDAIGIGRHIRVKPGANIPLDGIITEGSAIIDESMLSGEPIPVSKTIGDKVFSGCINGSSSFVVEVTKRSNDSNLANIIRSVKDAQGAKPPIGQLADQISQWFVPTIMLIAFFSALIWAFWGPSPQLTYAVITAISVLIIACPCALGLATPMSVMVGIGQAAKSGILIRQGDALQAAKTIDTLIVDKTGTLTKGLPTVIAADISEPLALDLALSLEKHSEHPLAQAITTYCNDQQATELKLDDLVISSGQGVQAIFEGKLILLGSDSFLNQAGINTHENKDIYSQVYLAVDNQIVARFDIDDDIREDSANAVKSLQKQGINVIIASGDNEASVSRVAANLGIESWHARMQPDAKMALIKNLQDQGLHVAMAGDGINDAPALALADISFAMNNGTDIAISSADVVMMHNSINNIVDAIKISRATMRNIKQNLFWAFAYNIVSIPVAAGILYPFTGTLLNPMIAGFAMAMSSITVVTNANRLKYQN